jgi:hypothetical protein
MRLYITRSKIELALKLHRQGLSFRVISSKYVLVKPKFTNG